MRLFSHYFWKSAVMIFLILFLAGCSGSEANPQPLPDQVDPEQTELKRSELEQSEIERLEAENERLRAELEEIAAAQEAQILEAENEEENEAAELAPTQVDPPQQDPKDALSGQWFLQKFHEEYIFSWAQNMVFYGNGTGMLTRTYYVPKDYDPNEYGGGGLPDFDSSFTFTWILEDDSLHCVLETGEIGDFIFSPEEQTFTNINSSTEVYAREKPAEMEGYIERNLFGESPDAKDDLIKRKFLGSWYYDVLVWTFNEDDTGDLDIPKLGDNPAEKRTFTYKIIMNDIDDSNLLMTIDWADGGTSYFWPKVHDDGSITLQGTSESVPIDLTRQFDPSNCPITKAIISAEMSVLSGSIFSEILPE